jgi:copper homeostasis protein
VAKPILEVIALDATDARAAQLGGADRLELVSDMTQAGLTPDPGTFASVRAATDLPIRVMLRSHSGYALTNATRLTAQAAALRDLGADEFVLGFLTPDGTIDLAALDAVLPALEGCRWTFHRALDHATDRAAAWQAISPLPGLDFVLTAGGPAAVTEGLPALTTEALRSATAGPRILAGGGLRPAHVPPLRAAGIDAFHTGSAARRDGRWDRPIDPSLVRAWRNVLDNPDR